MNITQGAVLPNSATVVEHSARSNGDTVVLARWERGGRIEYVTWRCDENGNAYWGHYFSSSITAAAADFDARCKE